MFTDSGNYCHTGGIDGCSMKSYNIEINGNFAIDFNWPRASPYGPINTILRVTESVREGPALLL